MKKHMILFFAIAVLLSCKNEKHQLVKAEASLFAINDSLESDQSIQEVIHPYTEKVAKEMNTIVSYAPKSLNKNDGHLESSLGNLFADLCLERSDPVFFSRTDKHIDFAMFNHGGMRSGINKGPVKVSNAYELMPFENELVVVEMTGKKVADLFHYLYKIRRAHPISGQVKLEITDSEIKSISMNNHVFDINRNYFVLTSDYLQEGGDHMVFFKDPISLYPLDYKIRNAIIDYFKEQDTIKSQLDNRFIKLKTAK